MRRKKEKTKDRRYFLKETEKKKEKKKERIYFLKETERKKERKRSKKERDKDLWKEIKSRN